MKSAQEWEVKHYHATTEMCLENNTKTMTLDEMKLAVCEKLPKLIYQMRWWEFSRPQDPQKNKWVGRSINWPTEGLQVCHEATQLLIAGKFSLEIFTNRAGTWTITFRSTDKVFVGHNNDLLTAWLEALCCAWFPERFN